MGDEDGLYRAVLQNPADDMPRLMLADWLDENDRPRDAEFIRAQVELAAAGGSDDPMGYQLDHTVLSRLRNDPCPCRLCHLRRVEGVALSGDPWPKSLGVRPPGCRVVYRRGFPTIIKGRLADLPAVAGAAFRLFPVEEFHPPGEEWDLALRVGRDARGRWSLAGRLWLPPRDWWNPTRRRVEHDRQNEWVAAPKTRKDRLDFARDLPDMLRKAAGVLRRKAGRRWPALLGAP